MEVRDRETPHPFHIFFQNDVPTIRVPGIVSVSADIDQKHQVVTVGRGHLGCTQRAFGRPNRIGNRLTRALVCLEPV
jgi:hypothetical protein